jgi:hypothetical protein
MGLVGSQAIARGCPSKKWVTTAVEITASSPLMIFIKLLSDSTWIFSKDREKVMRWL